MKKTLIFILAVLMAASCFVSCNETEPAGSESDVSMGEAGYDSETGRYVTDLPEFLWNAKDSVYATFDVAVTSDEAQSTYYSEDIGYDKYSTTDEVVNDAVRRRNHLVEERTGVVVTAVYVKDVVTAVQDDVAAGFCAYDMAMPFINNAVTLAQSGIIYDLRDDRFADYFNLEMPWWDQNANETFSIDGKLYFTTGDITIMTKINTWAITFNKEMYAELFPGEKSLYEIVEDGDWTFDKLVSFSKVATIDNGDGVWDYKDNWGLISAYSDARNYYTASGESLAEKTADDVPYVTFGSTRSVDVAQSILEEFSQKNAWHIYTNTLPVASPWVTALDMFAGGQVLFRTSVFSAIKKLRKYDDGIEFGIVPLPKFDAEQENYYSPSDPAGYAVVIPINAKDPEFSAYMTELVCCEAKNYLTPAYYETTLKHRDARDDESEEMLDLIFNNKKFDIGAIYNFGGIANMFSELSSQGSADIVSKFDSIKDSIETDIADTVDNFRD